jgi:acetylglutamate/LysW-gamma-L-alpha-aminoadipate kinase
VINLIEAPGFLANKDDESSLIATIPVSLLQAREEQATGRMKRKMLAIRKLFEHGASKVIIADGRRQRPVADALAGKGTLIE